MRQPREFHARGTEVSEGCIPRHGPDVEEIGLLVAYECATIIAVQMKPCERTW